MPKTKQSRTAPNAASPRNLFQSLIERKKGPIMKKQFIALAALATIASAGAFAGEADPSGQFALQIDGTRTRAEVQAEAFAAVQAGNTKPSVSDCRFFHPRHFGKPAPLMPCGRIMPTRPWWWPMA